MRMKEIYLMLMLYFLYMISLKPMSEQIGYSTLEENAASENFRSEPEEISVLANKRKCEDSNLKDNSTKKMKDNEYCIV